MRPSLLLLFLATLASSKVVDYECSEKAGHFMNRLIDLSYIPLEDALQHESFLFKENSTFWQERTLCSKKVNVSITTQIQIH